MPVRIVLAGKHHVASGQCGPFRDRQHRVVRGVGPFVVHQEGGQPFHVERHFGDHCPVRTRQICGHERRLPAVAPEQLDDCDALVRTCRRAQGRGRTQHRASPPSRIRCSSRCHGHRCPSSSGWRSPGRPRRAVGGRTTGCRRRRSEPARVQSEVLSITRTCGAVKSNGPSPTALSVKEGGHVAGIDPTRVRA